MFGPTFDTWQANKIVLHGKGGACVRENLVLGDPPRNGAEVLGKRRFRPQSGAKRSVVAKVRRVALLRRHGKAARGVELDKGPRGQADVDAVDSGAKHGRKSRGADGANSSGSVLVNFCKGGKDIAPTARFGHRGGSRNKSKVRTRRKTKGALAQKAQIKSLPTR